MGAGMDQVIRIAELPRITSRLLDEPIAPPQSLGPGFISGRSRSLDCGFWLLGDLIHFGTSTPDFVPVNAVIGDYPTS